jgi:transposase
VSQREDARYRRRERISRDRRGTLHRRLLVEAACHHRRPYRRPRPCATGGAWPRRRREPREPREPREDAGNQGLHERWLRFNEGKKRTGIAIANVAVARELAGWCWSFAMLADLKRPAARREPTPGAT